MLARGCREAAILSTCNRVEVYAVAPAGAAETPARLRGFLSEFHGLPEAAFEKSLYQFSDVEAVRHLFEVTASLDSQISVKPRFSRRQKKPTARPPKPARAGPCCARCLSAHFPGQAGARRGRHRHSQASISSAAVALAKKVFELKGCKVLVLGTGEMADGIVRALHAAGAAEIFAAGRTGERAAEFASTWAPNPVNCETWPNICPQWTWCWSPPPRRITFCARRISSRRREAPRPGAVHH